MTMPMERSDVADQVPRYMELLAISERGGRDETPLIDGQIPRDLNGSLYRNGPGLFERGALRKPHLLDGDGLVQRLSFADGKALRPEAAAYRINVKSDSSLGHARALERDLSPLERTIAERPPLIARDARGSSTVCRPAGSSVSRASSSRSPAAPAS